MQLEAEACVREVIENYGRSICDTPRMLETLREDFVKAVG